MALQLDYFNKIIAITSPTTEVDAQVLHDFVEDGMASPIGMVSDGANPSFWGDILKPEGKIEDENNPGIFSQIIIILNPEWQIQFWQNSGYTRIYGGKIVGGLNGQPMKATGAAGDITVLESPVDGLVVQNEKINDIHGQVTRSVYIDTELGVNGNGYQQSPFNNFTDAVDYAEANGLKNLVILADADIDRQLKNFVITGVGTPKIDTGVHNLDKSEFSRCTLTGLYTGRIVAQECNLTGTFNLNGFFENCAYGSNFIVPDGGIALVKDCSAFVIGQDIPVFDIGGVSGTGVLVVAGWNGGFKLINVNQVTDDVKLVMNVSKAVLDASCTGGQINVGGVTRLVNNSAGSTIVSEVLDPNYLFNAYTRLGLEKDNPWTDTPTQSRDANGTIILDNTGDGETTSTGTRQ